MSRCDNCVLNISGDKRIKKFSESVGIFFPGAGRIPWLLQNGVRRFCDKDPQSPGTTWNAITAMIPKSVRDVRH